MIVYTAKQIILYLNEQDISVAFCGIITIRGGSVFSLFSKVNLRPPQKQVLKELFFLLKLKTNASMKLHPRE